ncbi:AAA family ATPase [Kribbella sp. NPDC051137]|uniref:AAA family ATPase n=1 Tax=Kribbella sp. NPDC051137 TaxID=3155045 RepID=UPI00341DB94C
MSIFGAEDRQRPMPSPFDDEAQARLFGQPAARNGAGPRPAGRGPAPLAAGPRQTFRVLTRDEVRTLPEPEWLVRGLIPRVGTGQLYGPSNLGKTFVALDLVLSISSAREYWHGYEVRVPEPVPVVYVALEDEGDWKARTEAWDLANPGYDSSLALSAFPEGLVDLSDPAAAADWVAAFAQYRPAVVVVDTQAQASGGAEENSNTEMGRVMSNLRRISNRLQCFVMTVHHTGTTGRRARGASAQIGALDVVISVLPPSNSGSENASSAAQADFVEQPVTGVIAVEKNRRARKSAPTGFRLEPRGDSVWARPVARRDSVAISAAEAAGQRNQIARALVRLQGVAGSVAAIKKEIADHNEELAASTRGFKRALDEMCADGTVRRDEGQGNNGGARFTLADGRDLGGEAAP